MTALPLSRGETASISCARGKVPGRFSSTPLVGPAGTVQATSISLGQRGLPKEASSKQALELDGAMELQRALSLVIPETSCNTPRPALYKKTLSSSDRTTVIPGAGMAIVLETFHRRHLMAIFRQQPRCSRTRRHVR